MVNLAPHPCLVDPRNVDAYQTFIRCCTTFPSFSVARGKYSTDIFRTMYSYLLPLSLAGLATTVSAVPTLNIKRSLQTTPALAQDFPDPCIINVDGTWHAFATEGGGHSVQHATSPDFATWTYDDSDGVLPELPAWATGNVWGPSVIERVRPPPTYAAASHI